MEEESWRRNHRGEIMEEASLRRNLEVSGGIWHSGGLWELRCLLEGKISENHCVFLMKVARPTISLQSGEGDHHRLNSQANRAFFVNLGIIIAKFSRWHKEMDSPNN